MSSPSLHTVLGSTGNIGTQLAKELKMYTDHIRLVSRNPKKINSSDQIMKADLLLVNDAIAAVAGTDTVYLVVGITYRTKLWQEQWPIIMKNTIEACIKHKAKLVFFDNMYCYDPKHVGHLTESTPVNPKSKKGKVRAEIAQMILDEIDAGKLKAIIVRSADFYGPNARLSFLNESVINRMKAGKTAQWLYDKNKKHSFTYIPDAAKATVFLAQQQSAWDQIWHLPTSKEYPTGQEIVNFMVKELYVRSKMQVLPGFMVEILSLFVPLLKEVSELSYQLEQDYCFDSSKIEETYNLKPTPLELGLINCL